jgi:hypothetical protein
MFISIVYMSYINLKGMRLYEVALTTPDGTRDWVEVLANNEDRAEIVGRQRLRTSPYFKDVTDYKSLKAEVKQVSSQESDNYDIVIDKSGLVKLIFK